MCALCMWQTDKMGHLRKLKFSCLQQSAIVWEVIWSQSHRQVIRTEAPAPGILTHSSSSFSASTSMPTCRPDRQRHANAKRPQLDDVARCVKCQLSSMEIGGQLTSVSPRVLVPDQTIYPPVITGGNGTSPI